MNDFNFKVDISYDPSTGNVIDKITGDVISKGKVTSGALKNYIDERISKEVYNYKYSNKQQKLKNNPELQLLDPESIVKNCYGKPKSWAPRNTKKDKELLIKVIRYAAGMHGWDHNSNEKGFVDLNFIDIKNITDLSHLFERMGGFTFDENDKIVCMNYYDVSQWDTSGVTNMDYLFSNSCFTGDISDWDVSNVISMDGTFSNTSFQFNISNWDVSNVKSMYALFKESSFNQDISNWDVSNVEDMAFMFEHSKFNQDISNWDVSNVKNMARMFDESMFDGDISNWDVSNVKDMMGTFAYSKFNGDISNWDVSNVVDMRNIFQGSAMKNNLPDWYMNYMNSVKESSYKNKLANKFFERAQFSKDLKKMLNN